MEPLGRLGLVKRWRNMGKIALFILFLGRLPIESKQIQHHQVDYFGANFESAVQVAAEGGAFDMIIHCAGILHEGSVQPEKSLRNIDAQHLARIYQVNTILPALVAKYFIPHIDKTKRSVFACLSARVGSIEDNHLGGWYAYRMSKAALNMLIKNTAIEINRFHKQVIVLGLHPGTVKSDCLHLLVSTFQKTSFLLLSKVLIIYGRLCNKPTYHKVAAV